MTAATLDRTETDSLVGFEFDLPCDQPIDPRCEHAATWSLLNACCGIVSLRCDEHHERSLRLHESGFPILHVACDHWWPAWTEAGQRYSAIERL